jgi:AcrR family transcriptional regulator
MAKPAVTRSQAKQETREALIAAAAELFAAQGLDGPSLDAICEHAGRTRGAFYVHFADRDAIVEAVMERLGRRYLDALFGPDTKAGDLGSIVAQFTESFMRGEYPLAQPGGVRPHQLIDACARSPRVRTGFLALLETSVRRLTSAAAQSQASGAIRSDIDPDAVALLLSAVVIGAQTMFDVGAPFPIERVALSLMLMLTPRDVPPDAAAASEPTQPEGT